MNETTQTQTETRTLHLFKLTEGGCVTFTVAAHDAKEAERLVRAQDTVEAGARVEVDRQIPDDHVMWFVYPDGLEEDDPLPEGATVGTNPNGHPEVRATAAAWCRTLDGPLVLSCSEW